MAGSVLKRTCFYDVTSGTIRPHEWAVINYEGFGMMVEPSFWPFQTQADGAKGGAVAGITEDDFSSANDHQRVDEFLCVSDSGLVNALNSGSQQTPLHGGRHFPRKGR